MKTARQQLNDAPITSPQAAYLKHSGEDIDVKVTIRIVDGFPMIYIRDSEHRTFKSALAHLQHIAGSEMASTFEVLS